jgi:hypothetical protein
MLRDSELSNDRIASQRVRPEVAGPMTSSAKQSRIGAKELDCFVAIAPRNDRVIWS